MLLLSFCALVVCLLCYGGDATIVWHAGIQSVRKSASPHPKWKTTHMAWHIQYPWAQYACCTTDRISACKVSSCAYRGWSSPVRLSNARQSRGLPAPNGRWAHEVWLNENTNIAILYPDRLSTIRKSPHVINYSKYTLVPTDTTTKCLVCRPVV